MKKMYRLAAAAIATVPSIAWTGDLQPSATLAVRGANNPDRSSGATANTDIFEVSAEVGAKYTLATETLNATIDAALKAITFVDAPANYDDSVLPRLSGTYTTQIYSDRFWWSAEDTYGQIGDFELDSLNTSDRENANYFSTGPEARFQLGALTDLIASARFSSINFEKSITDNHSFGGELALQRRLSDRRSIALLGQYSETTFQESAFPGQKRNAAALRFQSAARRGSIVLQAGVGRADNGITATSGPSYLADLTRSIGTRSSLRLYAFREYQDSSSGLRFSDVALRQDSQGVRSLLTIADVSRADRASLEWVVNGARLGFRIAAVAAKDDYVRESSTDRERYGISAGVNYRLGPRSALALYASEDRQEIIGAGPTVKLRAYEVSYDHGMSHNLRLFVSAAQYRQGPGQSDPEKRIAVVLSYSPPNRTPGLARDPVTRQLGTWQLLRDQPLTDSAGEGSQR